MNRPAGVTASAVVEIIGSGLVLLTGGLMVVGMMMTPSETPALGPIIAVMAVIFAAFSGLGVWTGIALLRLRPWARISTLVFAGFMSLVSALAVVAMLLIPTPAMPDAQQQVSFSAMRPFLASMYAIPLGIGVWWLVYFNRAATKAAFAGPYVPGAPPVRPLSISIIGWLSVIGGLVVVPVALTGLPAFMAGFVFTGLSAKVVYLVFGVIGLYLGWSVLKLQEIGRKLMIAWYGLTMVHAAYVSLVPSVRAKFADAQRMMPFQTTTSPMTFDASNPTMAIVFMLFGVAFSAVIIWFLVKERARFS